MTVWVPVKSGAKYVRPLSTPEELRRMSEILHEPYTPYRRNYQHRQMHIKQLQQTGELLDVFQIVRDMWGWHIHNKLSYQERQTMQKFIRQLADEWALVFNMDKKEAEEYLENYLKTGGKPGDNATLEPKTKSISGTDVSAPASDAQATDESPPEEPPADTSESPAKTDAP